ncbi:MAG TPA: PEGA domain-containing protein, partial [Vicinamibacterales bacterium]
QDEEPHQDEEPQPQAAAAYGETAEQEPVSYQPDEEPAAPVVAPPPRAKFPDDQETKSPFSNPIVLGLVGALVVLLAVMGWLLTRDTMRAADGELVVQSRPEGAQVKIDGEVKGNTPLTVRLDAGAHVIEVQSGKSAPRVIPLMITAGMQTSQYVELQGVEKTGSLEIRSEPAGARITIDGRPRGTTPTTVSDLTPGDHTVVLESGGRKVSQTLRIQAGTAQQLSVPMRR